MQNDKSYWCKVGWLVGWLAVFFCGVSTLFGSFNAVLNFKKFSSVYFFVFKHLNVKIVLFQTIQFSISTQFSSIWPIDRTPSDATTVGQSGPRSDGNEVLCIPESSSITGTSPSDCLVSYIRTLVVCGGGVLPLCREAVGVFYSPSRLDNIGVRRY